MMPIKNGHIPFSEIPIWEWIFFPLFVVWSIKTINRVLSTLRHKSEGVQKQDGRSRANVQTTLPNPPTIPVTMAQIDQMDGLTFERFLKAFFEKQGYYATITPHYDWGGDLVMHKDGIRTLVQAKRWKQQVSMSAVQEVVAAKAKYRADRVMVVTNSTFTYKAKELARVNDVVLWNRETLTAQLRLFPVIFAEGAAHEFTASCEQEPQKSDEPPAPSNTAETQARDIKPQVSSTETQASETALPCCELCGKLVTEAVADYCRANVPRFDGNIYCFAHQKAFSRRKEANAPTSSEAVGDDVRVTKASEA